MSLITPRSNTQYSGLTGRKINPPLNQILASQMPAATQILAAEARRRQEEERLIQEQKLKQEAIAMQEQQARTAALIRGGTTGIQLAKLIKDPEFMPQLTGKATELITQAAGLNELNKIALPLVLDPAAEGTKTIGATVAPIAAAQEAGKTALEEGGKIAAQEAGKTVAQEAGKTALEEGGKIAAQEAGKTAATTGIGTTLKSIATSIAPYMTYHALRRGGQALLGYGLQELGGSENNVISQFGRTVSNTSNIEDIPFEWAKELDVVSAKNIRPFEWALNPAGKVLDFIDNPSNFFKDSCMIVTACTSRKSPEVEIAREYRDKFLTRRQLRGYYMLAEKIVPRMHRSPRLTRLIKRWLVDPLIVYGRHALVKTAPPPWRYERIIATAFLALIGCIGRTRKQFTRANGEVY
ncbi:MAG TPA: hypothetical protein PKW17_10240 [Smithellaceae bacterium]|nr:hypothetical protein [Smithellaceae bacterium]